MIDCALMAGKDSRWHGARRWPTVAHGPTDIDERRRMQRNQKTQTGRAINHMSGRSKLKQSGYHLDGRGLRPRFFMDTRQPMTTGVRIIS